MAVLTFTVSIVGGVPQLTPDPTPTMIIDRDFMIFQLAPGLTTDVWVKVVGAGLPEISVAIDDQDPPNALRLGLLPPTIDPADGSVLITFGPFGGASGGFPPS